jgi:hypothetical protein
MNWKQKLVLWLGIIVFVGMTLYPPALVQQPFEMPGGSASYREETVYMWLFDVPSGKINYDRLLMQWAIVFAVTLGGLSSLKDAAPVKRVRD